MVSLLQAPLWVVGLLLLACWRQEHRWLWVSSKWLCLPVAAVGCGLESGSMLAVVERVVVVRGGVRARLL